MRCVVVPNHLSDAIYKVVDAQLRVNPQFEKYREDIYKDILDFYDKNGVIPDFTIEKGVAWTEHRPLAPNDNGEK